MTGEVLDPETGTTYRHGTLNGYHHHRCRCNECRAVHAAYMAEWKAGTAPLPPEDERHGTLNAYTNYGCRCPDCLAAHRDYRRELRARKRRNTALWETRDYKEAIERVRGE